MERILSAKRLERILSRGWAGREAGLEAGEAGVKASLEASRHEASSARLKSLEAGLACRQNKGVQMKHVTKGH